MTKRTICKRSVKYGIRKVRKLQVQKFGKIKQLLMGIWRCINTYDPVPLTIPQNMSINDGLLITNNNSILLISTGHKIFFIIFLKEFEI